MVFGQKLKILTLGGNDTSRKHISRGTEWHKFQLCSTFQRGTKRITNKQKFVQNPHDMRLQSELYPSVLPPSPSHPHTLTPFPLTPSHPHHVCLQSELSPAVLAEVEASEHVKSSLSDGRDHTGRDVGLGRPVAGGQDSHTQVHTLQTHLGRGRGGGGEGGRGGEGRGGGEGGGGVVTL